MRVKWDSQSDNPVIEQFKNREPRMHGDMRIIMNLIRVTLADSRRLVFSWLVALRLPVFWIEVVKPGAR
jgi:hypothetical protein